MRKTWRKNVKNANGITIILLKMTNNLTSRKEKRVRNWDTREKRRDLSERRRCMKQR